MDTPIPKLLPLTGNTGHRRLKRLQRRAEFLKSRITHINPSESGYRYDKAEISALEWVIEKMLEYEKRLSEAAT